MTKPIWLFIKSIFNSCFQYFFSFRCYYCSALLDQNLTFCSSCWKRITFISDVYCRICGTPIVIGAKVGFICAKCISSPPKFTLARSIMMFDQNSKKLIYLFKYGDKTYLSEIFAHLLLKRYKLDILDIDFVIPVPMHKIRRLFRKYNPAQLLAKSIANRINKKMLPDLLIKTKLTKSQKTLSRKERLKNLHNSIEYNTKYDVKDKVILLVDDVYTTGATSNLCSQVLFKSAKVKKVKVFFITTTGSVRDT